MHQDGYVRISPATHVNMYVENWRHCRYLRILFCSILLYMLLGTNSTGGYKYVSVCVWAHACVPLWTVCVAVYAVFMFEGI